MYLKTTWFLQVPQVLVNLYWGGTSRQGIKGKASKTYYLTRPAVEAGRTWGFAW